MIGDYLTLLFTGMHCTEIGAAAFTALVEIDKGRWWSDFVERLQLDPAWLPTLVQAGTDLGPIRATMADRYGLPHDCRFIVGCFDQYAGPVGVGNFKTQILSETTGTVLASVRCADAVDANLNESVFQGPKPVGGGYYRLVYSELAANYLERYREQLPGRPSFAELDQLAATAEIGAGGLSLNGAAPGGSANHWFTGWTSRNTRADAVRCLLESVAWELGEQVARLSPADRPAEVRAAGGGARSPLWLQIKADILGLPMVATTCTEPASLGVAMIAEATRSNASVLDIAEKWVKLGRIQEPNQASHREYRALNAG